MSKLECVIQMCCRDLKQAGLVLIHSCNHEASIIKPSFISVVSLPVNLLSICYSRESLLNSELSKIAFKTL